MNLQPIESQAEEWIDKQSWIETYSNKIQEFIKRAFRSAGSAGRIAANLLNGTWLGHPLHTVITDLPIGAWTSSLFLDALAMRKAHRRRYRKGAEILIGIGIAGALGAATAGVTDWQHLSGKTKKIGFIHGLLNILSLLFYSSSLLLRRKRQEQTGRNMALVGFGLSMAAAYLGGGLVFRHRVGVDHSESRPLPQDFVRIIEVNQLVDRTLHKVEWNGIGILLVRNGDQVSAIGETCAHLGGPLSEGTFQDGIVTCPLHGSQFDVVNGKLKQGPSVYSQPCYEVRVRDGWVEVRQPELLPEKNV